MTTKKIHPRWDEISCKEPIVRISRYSFCTYAVQHLFTSYKISHTDSLIRKMRYVCKSLLYWKLNNNTNIRESEYTGNFVMSPLRKYICGVTKSAVSSKPLRIVRCNLVYAVQHIFIQLHENFHIWKRTCGGGRLRTLQTDGQTDKQTSIFHFQA